MATTFRDPQAVGAEIARLRQKADVDQRELAAQLGIDASAVSRIEHGQRGVSAEELYRIAEFFGVEPSAILMTEERDLVLLRNAAASDQEVKKGLEILDAAIEDFFSAQALSRLL
jgi:transcriptional regulator with XRE-family HTH domain